MLRVALTPNSFLPNCVLPITLLQILQQLAVCKVELLLVWLVHCSAQRPFCFSFFAYIPISTANHTHWSLQNQMHEQNPLKAGYTQKPIMFFADLYKQAYSWLDLVTKWPSNIKWDADNAKTGTHKDFPCLPEKISCITSIFSSKKSGGNQTPQLLTLSPPTMRCSNNLAVVLVAPYERVGPKHL